MNRRVQRVFVFSTHDISKVQGTTEAHYVSKYFGRVFDTHVIAPLSSDIEGTNSHDYSSTGLLGILVINLLLLPRWIWLAARRRPDVVYAYRNVILPPLAIKLLFGSVIVYDLRVDPYRQPKEFNPNTLANSIFVVVSRVAHAVALRFADVVLTLSDPLEESIVESFWLSRSDIRIVPLGVDPDVFEPAEANSGGFDIAYVGSIKPHRGVESIVEALNELPADVQADVSVQLFGPAVDEYVGEIEKLAANRAYTLNWHGLVPHQEIPERVGRCDCAVSPLPLHEGFEVSSPAKIYEYLALGLPIVATAITPHERILQDGHDSILVAPDDPPEMAAAFRRLKTDDAFRAELAANSRRKGIANGWDTRVNTILDALDGQSELRVDHRF